MPCHIKTVALNLGTGVPKGSKIAIRAEMRVIELPLKFEYGTFGAIKFFQKIVLSGSFTGSEPVKSD